jgi:AcrR family transcriptional regulator
VEPKNAEGEMEPTGGEPEPAEGAARLRSRDRRVTERRILDATWRLFEEEGPLAGINLQRVADEAGINRSLVYQYFGDREQLVRTALTERLRRGRPLFRAGHALPFAERKRQTFAIALADPAPARLITQLVLAGNEEIRALPLLAESRDVLARDLADGSLPPGADAEVMHAMTVVLALGYAVFRDAVAAELDIDPVELDDRAADVYGLMLEGLVARGDSPRPGHPPTAAPPAAGDPGQGGYEGARSSGGGEE